MKKNIEELRSELIDYFGSAGFSGMPMAFMDLAEVENASEEKLLEIANRNGFDISEYLTEDD